MAVKVKDSEVRDLFKGMGFAAKGVDAWSEKRLQDKIKGLPKHAEDESKIPKKENLKVLLDKLVEAVEDGNNIVLQVDAKTDPKKPAKVGKKEPDPEEDEDEEDEESEGEDGPETEDDESDEDEETEEDESDDDNESDEESDDEESDDESEEVEEEDEESDSDDEEEESEDEDSDDETDSEDEEESDEETEDEDEKVETKTKPKKKSTDKKKSAIKSAGGDGKPGILASIGEFLLKASEKNPLSKNKLVVMLKKRFPDREESSLKSTVNQQVPTKQRLAGVDVRKSADGKGYYAVPGKPKPKKK